MHIHEFTAPHLLCASDGESMSRTRSVAATTHQPLPLSLLAGALFFFLTWAGIKALKRLEAKVRIPGYAHQGTL